MKKNFLLNNNSANKITGATKRVLRMPENRTRDKSISFKAFNIVLARITDTNLDSAGNILSYNAEEVVMETPPNGYSTSLSGRTWSGEYPLYPYLMNRDLLVGEIVYVWSFGTIWFCNTQLQMNIHFLGYMLETEVYINGGYVVLPDATEANVILANSFPLIPSPLDDTYIYIEVVLDKTSGAFSINGLLTDTTEPITFTETLTDITWNYIIGSIIDSRFEQYIVGDIYVPMNIYQAGNYSQASSTGAQMLGHLYGELNWFNTDTCD